MIYVQNIHEYEHSLRNYLAKGEYTQPFVVAGWSGIGKTAIAEKIRQEFPALQIQDFYLEKEADEVKGQIKNACQLNVDNPRIICVTTGIDMSVVREIAHFGCELYYLYLDTELWLDWAKQINPTTGRANIDKMFIDSVREFPQNLDNRIQQREQMLSEIENTIQAITSYRGSSETEIFGLLDKLFILQQVAYLYRTHVDEQWENVLKALSSILPKLEPKAGYHLKQRIMRIGQMINEFYFDCPSQCKA